MNTTPARDADPPAPLDPRELVAALCAGYFPMAKSADAEDIGWYRPDPRAIMPLGENTFHVRRSLAKALRKHHFDIRHDVDFVAVMDACAEPRAAAEDGESGTWINATIRGAYAQLADLGLGHSVEAFTGDQRVGGLYGVALGGAFLAESMYSRKPYASQACLVALVEYLRRQGFTLMDVQFVNPHLEQFGVQEISCAEYRVRLEKALTQPTVW
ncbi:MAG: leucyl/phenylalanyl-tRNA--protein transferase [Planctomycetota bacterium]